MSRRAVAFCEEKKRHLTDVFCTQLRKMFHCHFNLNVDEEEKSGDDDYATRVLVNETKDFNA